MTTMNTATRRDPKVTVNTMNPSEIDQNMTNTEHNGEDQQNGRMIGKIVWSLFLDAGLAVLAYLIAKQLGASLFVALLIGAVVALLRAGYVIIRRREVDAFAIFMIITFGIGLLLTVFTGSARFLLAKDSISSAICGITFGVTLIFGKPMMYYFSQRFGATSDAERHEWAQRYTTSPEFRNFFRGLTLVWVIAFLVEAAVKLALVLLLPVATMAPVVPFFTPVLVTCMVIWTVRRSTAAQRRLSNLEETA